MLDKTVTNWQAAADELNIEGRAFINGQMTDALSGETRPSINTAHKVAAAVRVGTKGIYNYFGGDITVPFGGFKQSGNGRDKSIHAFNDYTELKTTWIEFE